MNAARPLLLAAFALSACAVLPGIAHAEGLQVAPVSVTIPERAGVLWLTNQGDQPLRAQVRVFRWSQVDGEDVLTETTDLVASPPFVAIAAQAQQVVRLVRLGETASAAAQCEQTFRIIVDELPGTPAPEQTGLQYVLRYSVPVYLTNPACQNSAPVLTWRLEAAEDGVAILVENTGQQHAQLADLALLDSQGQRLEVQGGLVGYVLPGQQRRFAVPGMAASAANGGNLEVSVNGARVIAPVLLSRPGQ